MAVINELSEVVLFHRKQAKLSRKNLATLAGVGKTVIYDVEKGRKTIRWSTIISILHVLNVSIEFQSPLMELHEASSRKNS